jgi:hypothetical protein
LFDDAFDREDFSDHFRFVLTVVLAAPAVLALAEVSAGRAGAAAFRSGKSGSVGVKSGGGGGGGRIDSSDDIAAESSPENPSSLWLRSIYDSGITSGAGGGADGETALPFDGAPRNANAELNEKDAGSC